MFTEYGVCVIIYDMQKLIEFDSGLRLVFTRNPAVRSIALGVFVGAGAVTESEDLSGISHFIEHMVFKGTSSRSAFDIVNEIDSIGAQINAYTTKSATCFYTVSLDSNAEKCADVLSDLYFHPKFDPEELEKERRVVIEEINESEDTPDDICLERLASVFFGSHPLAKPILGTKGTLMKMTDATLRDYKERFYTPDNTVISIAGNLTEAEARGLAEKYFETRCSRSAVSARSRVSHAEIKSGFTRKKKSIEQAHIAFAFPCVAYDDEKSAAVRLMSAVFGTEMSSRLFQGVREKLGLCYTVGGYPSAYENNGSFIIFTSTNPESVERAVLAIRDEIDALVKFGITDEELAKGKEQLKTSMVLGQESTSSMMRVYGRHALQTGKLYDVNEKMKEIDALKLEDISDAARYIFDYDKVSGSLVAQDTGVDIVKLIRSDKKL